VTVDEEKDQLSLVCRAAREPELLEQK